jgi:hypothetical protein
MDAAEMFLKYDYAETKDLLKTFLTLISGTLVLSLTFSDKVIGFSNASILTRRVLFSAWALFIAALIFAGTGLGLVAAAAGTVLYGGIPFFHVSFGALSTTCWALILLAGVTFVIGLITLAIAAGLSVTSKAAGSEASGPTISPSSMT